MSLHTKHLLNQLMKKIDFRCSWFRAKGIDQRCTSYNFWREKTVW